MAMHWARVAIFSPLARCQNLLLGPGLALTPQLTWKEPPQEPSAARVLPLSLGHVAPVGLGTAEVVVVVVLVLVEVESVVAGLVQVGVGIVLGAMVETSPQVEVAAVVVVDLVVGSTG